MGLDFVGSVGPLFPELTVLDHQLMQRNMGNGAAVGDYDDDGDLDVYLLAQQGLENRLYRNVLDMGTKGFEDVTGVTPAVADLGLSRVAFFADLDGDGDLDLLLINDDNGTPDVSPSKVLRNDGAGTFTDATPGSGFRPVGYLRAGAAHRAGLLEMATDDVGANHLGNDMGIACADFDDDGDLDMYTANIDDPSGALGRFPFTNAFYVNQAERTGSVEFVDEAVDRGVEDTYWG
jgi:hypothetical protein